MRSTVLVIVLLYCISSNSQNNEFGVKGGFNFTFFKVIQGEFGSNPSSETGYYGGLFLDFKIEEGFRFQPELLYIGLNDFQFINAPLYCKYNIAPNFHILVGPSFNYFFDFFTNKIKIRADISTSYDILPNVDLHLKYTIGFKEISPNGLFIGAGFTF